MKYEDSRFWDRVAEKYAQKPIPNEEIYQRKIQMTQRYLNAESEVLELACGTGGTALIHSPYVKSIVATDFSEKMIEIAKTKANEKNVKNIFFESKAIEELDYEKETFDVVMAHSIIHIVEDKERVIKKAFEWLKPGGVFVSSTPCVDEIFIGLRYVFPLAHRLGLVPLVRTFRVKDLVEAHRNAGFQVNYQWRPNRMGVFLIAVKR